MFDADTVITINTWIDKYHGPNQFTPFVVMGMFVLLEVILPKKNGWENLFDKVLGHIKMGLVTLTMLVATSQGITGGCIIQIPQNWLARQALGRDWYPFGLVYREYVPQDFWWALRLFYFLGGLFILVIWWLWMEKRFWFETQKQSQKSYLQSLLSTKIKI